MIWPVELLALDEEGPEVLVATALHLFPNVDPPTGFCLSQQVPAVIVESLLHRLALGRLQVQGFENP
jgi:hypothetical protein